MKPKHLNIFLTSLVSLLFVNGAAHPLESTQVIAGDYVFNLPKNVPTGEQTPILVALPGWGMSAELDKDNWVFHAMKNKMALINFEVDYESIKSENEVKALFARIETTLDRLKKEYPIDDKKVFLAGTSAGGMMAIAVGLRYPERFAAVGAACGGILRFGAANLLKNAEKVSFYLSHGDKDEVVPFSEFEETVAQLKKNGGTVNTYVHKNGGHHLPAMAYRKIVEGMTRH